MFLKPKEVAEVLNVSRGELNRNRQKGQGVPYYKLGDDKASTVVYRIDDVLRAQGKRPTAIKPLSVELTTQELADLLGVHKNVPYRWRNKGLGPVFDKSPREKPQGWVAENLRYPANHVEAWLCTCRVATDETSR